MIFGRKRAGVGGTSAVDEYLAHLVRLSSHKELEGDWNPYLVLDPHSVTNQQVLHDVNGPSDGVLDRDHADGALLLQGSVEHA